MSRTTKIIAQRTMRYGTRMLQAGDIFDAKARDARLLIAIGRAKPVSPEVTPSAPVEPTAQQVEAIREAIGVNAPPASAEVPSLPLIEALRQEYLHRSGQAPDKRWGIPKLTKEVSALRNAV